MRNSIVSDVSARLVGRSAVRALVVSSTVISSSLSLSYSGRVGNRWQKHNGKERNVFKTLPFACHDSGSMRPAATFNLVRNASFSAHFISRHAYASKNSTKKKETLKEKKSTKKNKKVKKSSTVKRTKKGPAAPSVREENDNVLPEEEEEDEEGKLDFSALFSKAAEDTLETKAPETISVVDSAVNVASAPPAVTHQNEAAASRESDAPTIKDAPVVKNMNDPAEKVKELNPSRELLNPADDGVDVKSAAAPLSPSRGHESSKDTESLVSSVAAEESSMAASSPSPSISPSLTLWPIDAGEFNATLIDGGHRLRTRRETQFDQLQFRLHLKALQQRESTQGANVSSSVRGHKSSSSSSNAQEPLSALGQAQVFSTLPSAEKLLWINQVLFPPTTPTKAGRSGKTKSDGSTESSSEWACDGCGAHHIPRTRTRCTHCGFVGRHVAQSEELRRAYVNPLSWICPSCFEFNEPSSRSQPPTTSTGAQPVHVLHCKCCGENCEEIDENAFEKWRTDKVFNDRHARNLNEKGNSGSQISSGAEGGGPALFLVERETVATEINRSPIGSVLVKRNRTARWRCDQCYEMNSLQSMLCRCCGRDRYDISVVCRVCKTENALSNALMYGEEHMAKNQKLPNPLFGTHNYFPPAAPTVRCTSCHSLLHGSLGKASRWVWMCGCGLLNASASYEVSVPGALKLTGGDETAVQRHANDSETQSSVVVEENNEPLEEHWNVQKTATRQMMEAPTATLGGRMSCSRCRLPRFFPYEELLEDVSKKWDFSTCSTWFCESCNGINKASRTIIVSQKDESGKQKRTTTVVHGVSHCLHCTMPWHHQTLSDGANWRCACHYVNNSADAACASCGLLGVDGIRCDVISEWNRGDWYCVNCKRHNYRERLKCACGAERY